MNKTRIISLVAIAATGIAVASWYWYPKHIPQGKIHGLGVKSLSCSDDTLFSLQLSLDHVQLWKKSHRALFAQAAAEPYLDRRFRDKSIYPVDKLLSGHEDVTAIEFIPCGGEKIMMSASEILKHPNTYFLGPNRHNRMKLLRYQGKQHYSTIERNVIEVNLVP